jgi:hypothetical protein
VNQAEAANDLHPLSPRAYDREFLDWVKGFPCARCGAAPPSDPHHLRSGGMGLKCHDYESLALCRKCHDFVENKGKKTFAQEMGDKIEEARILYLSTYIYAKKVEGIY